MKVISTISEIDNMLRECDAAVTDEELREVFARYTFSMDLANSQDPFGSVYKETQRNIYRHISGREYKLDNEHSYFDLESAVLRPFPYSTASSQVAGDHMVLIGSFLRAMRLPPAAQIVEFGPGWGNLTLMLARLGYDVTAIDVEPNFCELIGRRAANAGVAIKTQNDDFSVAKFLGQKFDAAIFFECFHHAADHISLLIDLHDCVKPDGVVYLGAEPILSDFPVPWGLRMDGQTLWAVRSFGWMELGFSDSYFVEAANRCGWVATRHETPHPAIWTLTAGQPIERDFPASSERLGFRGVTRPGSSLCFEGNDAGVLLYGPYVPLSKGSYTGFIQLVPQSKLRGTGIIQACIDRSNFIIESQHIDISQSEAQGYIQIDFDLKSGATDVEIRLLNVDGLCVTVAGVSIEDRQIERGL